MPRRNLSSTAAIAILSSIFFAWGALTCLNDVLIPHLKAVFSMNYAQTMLIQFVFFTSYLVFSLPSGWFLAQVGYKRGIMTGLVVMAGQITTGANVNYSDLARDVRGFREHESGDLHLLERSTVEPS